MLRLIQIKKKPQPCTMFLITHTGDKALMEHCLQVRSHGIENKYRGVGGSVPLAICILYSMFCFPNHLFSVSSIGLSYNKSSFLHSKMFIHASCFCASIFIYTTGLLHSNRLFS